MALLLILLILNPLPSSAILMNKSSAMNINLQHEVAFFIAKRILPETRPVFSDMTDLELLSLVSWAEKSDAKRI